MHFSYIFPTFSLVDRWCSLSICCFGTHTIILYPFPDVDSSTSSQWWRDSYLSTLIRSRVSLLSSEVLPILSIPVLSFVLRLLVYVVYIFEFCLVLWVFFCSDSSTDLIGSWKGSVCIFGPFSWSHFRILYMFPLSYHMLLLHLSLYMVFLISVCQPVICYFGL